MLEKDAHLWWPDNHVEAAFVRSFYSTSTAFHVGYRTVTEEFGILHSDYSVGTGLYDYFTDKDETPLDSRSDYMNPAGCVVFDTADVAKTALAATVPCPPAKGICKTKLG